MSPRPRKRNSRDLPPHLYAKRQRGKTYYRYRHPVTGKWYGMGQNKARAVKAAQILNSRLMEPMDAERLAASVTAERETAGEVLSQYLDEVLPKQRNRHGRTISPKTLEEQQRAIRDAIRDFGATPVQEVTRRRIGKHLGQYPGRSANARRSTLRKAWAWVVASGYRDDNPVEGTLRADEHVQRRRLTLEEFRRIRSAAEPWLQNALDLALQTLQRRGDLVRMRFDDIADGCLYVRQRKTAGEESANLRIRISPELQEVIARCRDDVVSPFLIHRPPAKRRREYMESRDHWTQVDERYLTRAFAAVRDELGIASDLPTGQRPSLHEVRALGGRLYREAGWSEEAVQRLMGHSSAAMTRHYLSRHGETWVDCESGLDTGQNPGSARDKTGV